MKYYTTNKEAFLEQIKYSFELFKEKNGRYPLSYEIKVGGPYSFPSAKTLDRHFGGVKNVRKLLGMEVENYSSGKERSDKMNKVILPRFIESEADFYRSLTKFFSEESINNQQTYKPNSNIRSDFIIKHDGNKFGIDIFHASEFHSLSGCINSKINKLASIVDVDIFLVSVSDTISEDDINRYLKGKKKPLNSNISIMTKDTFLKYLQDNMNKI